jgi:hypothetical protein
MFTGFWLERRPRHGREDNMKMNLREIGIDGTNWIWLAQDRVRCRAFVSTVMNLSGCIKEAGYSLKS